MKHLHRWLLLGIILLASILRLYQLGTVPPSLNWDETAWGYNAYSLGIDGRDEFGRFLPYDYLESFGDFKPPLYAYTAVIPVKLFGLTAFSTRLPSAFFGILTVVLTYFLVKQVFYSAKQKEYYALFTAFILAISPWHIMLSRAAFEANLVTFFLVLGVWLFLFALQKHPWYLVLSAIPFALSLYTFNTARIVAPLLVLLLGVSFHRELFKLKKQTVIALVLGFCLVLPVIPFLLSPQASLRFREVNIFSDPLVIQRVNQEVVNDNNAFWSKALHHRYLNFGAEFVKHYLDHFDPEYLFIKGDLNPKFSTRDVGALYLFELPFFIAGIIMLIKRKEGYWWLVPVWLLLAIIPAAVARETPHSLRIETAIPTFQIFTAVGLSGFFLWLKKQKKLGRSIGIGLLSITIFLNVLYYLHGYYTHYAREYSHEWQYGYVESVPFVLSVKDAYDEIHITEELGRPYIYYLFGEKTNPKDFRKNAKVERDVFGFVHVLSYDKYRFMKHISPSKESGKKIMYVTIPGEVPKGANILKEFKALNGTTQLVAFII